jgi:molybdopterin converting factor small subunit
MRKNQSVSIEVSGILRQHVDPGTTVKNVNTVGDAVIQLNLPKALDMIMVVNGKIAYWNTELEHGDTLQLLPAISGG